MVHVLDGTATSFWNLAHNLGGIYRDLELFSVSCRYLPVVDIYEAYAHFFGKDGALPPFVNERGGISNLGGATIFCTFVYIKFCENCTFWL